MRRGHGNVFAPLGDLWQKLKKEQANLSFTQSVLETVLASLNDDAWRQTAAKILDWTKTMGKRFRCACRHIQQAASKKTTRRGSRSSASATTTVLQDTHKWDAELKRCNRSLPGELQPPRTTVMIGSTPASRDDTVKEVRGSLEDDLGKGNSKGQKKGKNQGKSLSSNSVCPTNKKNEAKWIATPRHPT